MRLSKKDFACALLKFSMRFKIAFILGKILRLKDMGKVLRFFCFAVLANVEAGVPVKQKYLFADAAMAQPGEKQFAEQAAVPVLMIALKRVFFPNFRGFARCV